MTTTLFTGRKKSGHIGGSATFKKLGKDFYRTIGRKGGSAKKRVPAKQ